MNTINWTEIIKYGMAMALAGGITGGGAAVERTYIENAHQVKIEKLVKVLFTHIDGCKGI